MKTRILILFIVIISASITAITAPIVLYSSDNTDDEKKFLEENDTLNSNDFGFKFYRHLSDSDDNLFFSPISIDIVFAIIYEAAQDETREKHASII